MVTAESASARIRDEEVEQRIERLRIPVHMRGSLPAPSYGKHICGYCATGAHEHCKRAIRNGNGSVHLCPCQDGHPGPAIQAIKCLECYNTDLDELDEKLWACWDVRLCASRIQDRLDANPDYQRIHQSYVNAAVTTAKERAERPARNRNPGRPSSGQCLCCGEKTGGGMFLPGHDARLVSIKAKEVEAGANPLEVLAAFKALGVSEKLYAKLERKLERQ